MKKKKLTFEEFQHSVLEDYRIVCESREASLLGRKEVLTGKAKFGIFGDGKEVAQVAMARTFKHGDFRSFVGLAGGLGRGPLVPALALAARWSPRRGTVNSIDR